MKVFLSSTYQDLIPYRSAAALAIERLGQQGIRMEVFGARSMDATTASLGEIEASDVVLAIYAHRYGFVPDGQPIAQEKSITEQEFDYAKNSGKQILCFIVDSEYPWLPKYIEPEPGRTRLSEFLAGCDPRWLLIRLRHLKTSDSRWPRRSGGSSLRGK